MFRFTKGTEKLKDFFFSRTVGFYLSAAGALVALIAAVWYSAGYANNVYLSTYYTFGVNGVLFLGVLLFVAAAPFSATERLAPTFLSVCALAAFCVNVRTSYVYLTTVFYGGVTAEAMAMIDPAFSGTLALSLVAMALGIAGTFLRQSFAAPAERSGGAAAHADGGEK